MINFLLLMLIPTAIACGTLWFFNERIHKGEFAAQLLIPVFVLGLGYGISYWQSTTDVEILNGRVTNKVKETVSCSHSYKCNCYTTCSGSGSKRSCDEHCSTCYEHSYDYDWAVYSSYGTRLTIDRVDRQGVDTPARWNAVFPGEPFSSSQNYTNYILANRSSVLLGGQGDLKRWEKMLPPYPSGIMDYYRAQHTINVGGVPIQDPMAWEWLLDEVNGDLGPRKQVNVIVMFVKTDDPSYMLALKDSWVGGKKNDVIVVFGTLDGKKIAFADILSWTPKFIFKVELRDELMEIGSLDKRDALVAAIRNTTLNRYERLHMKDLEYLSRAFQPSTTAMFILFLLGTATSIGLAFYAVMNEIDNDGNLRYNRYGSNRYNRRMR